MNRYRAYMDRVTVSPGFHHRLLDRLDEARRTPPPRRRPAALRYGAVAAGCALVLLAGWGLLWDSAAQPGTTAAPAPGVAATPAPPTSAEPSFTSAPTPYPEDQYTLEVEDHFNGQPHSSFYTPALEFTCCDIEGSITADYALQEVNSIYQLTAQDIVHALGGTDEVPWTLGWEGFTLGGNTMYGLDGELLWAVITGKRDQSSAELSLWLAPGTLPPADTIYPEAVETEYDGTPITLYYAYLGSGRWRYYVDFLYEDTGVRFQCTSRDQEEAARLANRLAVFGSFTTQHLQPDEAHLISRSASLTLEEAQDDPLSCYLPASIPQGFTCDSARSSFSQDVTFSPPQATTALSAFWSYGYSYIQVGVRTFPPAASISAPDFTPDEITPEALEAWGRYVDDDAGDVPGWRYPQFSIQYPAEDRPVQVTYSIKGLDPEQAAALVRSAACHEAYSTGSQDSGPAGAASVHSSCYPGSD